MLETYFRLTRGKIGRSPEMSSDARLREALVPRGRRSIYEGEAHAVAQSGLATGLLAEASWRLAGNRFLLTPAAAGLGRLRFDQLLVGAPGALPPSAPPAAEWHLGLYANCPAGAALLSQPPATMALLAAGRSPDSVAWPAAARLLGDVLLVERGTTPAPDHFAGRSFLLLADHGLFTWGDSLSVASAVAETTERWSEISRLSREGNSW